MCRWIETIGCFFGEIPLLNYHEKRVNETFKKFLPQHNPFSISEKLKKINIPIGEVSKIRILYSIDIEEISIEPYRYLHHKIFHLVENPYLDYSYKYAQRDFFEQLKSGAHDDEFFITQNGKITDCTYGNLIFWDGSTWITPKTYLLNGVQRQFLLNERKIKEEEITVETLKRFSKFRIINALNPLEGPMEYPIEAIKI